MASRLDLCTSIAVSVLNYAFLHALHFLYYESSRLRATLSKRLCLPARLLAVSRAKEGECVRGHEEGLDIVPITLLQYKHTLNATAVTPGIRLTPGIVGGEAVLSNDAVRCQCLGGGANAVPDSVLGDRVAYVHAEDMYRLARWQPCSSVPRVIKCTGVRAATTVIRVSTILHGVPGRIVSPSFAPERSFRLACIQLHTPKSGFQKVLDLVPAVPVLVHVRTGT